jgi:hypothetical protein
MMAKLCIKYTQSTVMGSFKMLGQELLPLTLDVNHRQIAWDP